MKRILLSSLTALGLSGLTAQACLVSGVVACPNGITAAGIVLYVSGVGSTSTSGNGAYLLELPGPGSYTLCVDESTLPSGLSLVGNNCTKVTVDYSGQEFADVNFTLKGPLCENTPPPGPCWLTGGGTIGKTKGMPDYTYGGVVNPGCSPFAAGGGNWNVVDHLHNLHFKGIDIAVIECSGVSTKSPKVEVNVIDFMGTGIIEGVSGDATGVTPVNFIAQATDASEPGAGKDMLYLNVMDATSGATLLLISADPGNPANVAPVTISTGNLQIHTTGCD